MRQAPAVRVPCVDGALVRNVPLALAGLTAAAMAAWLTARLGGTVASSAIVAAAVACAGLAWGWRRSLRLARCTSVLQWDGAAWSLLIDAASTGSAAQGQALALERVDVMMDLGGWLLLRARPARGAVRWLPMRERDVGADFRAVCRALYARTPGRGVLGDQLPQ
jgi:hypothetical protein